MTKNLTEGDPTRLIFFFALPLVAGNMMQQLYAFIDTLIVGRFLGVNALAAVGCTGSLMFLALGFLMGFHAPEGSVRAIFNGGGLVSMLEISATRRMPVPSKIPA